LLPTWHHLGFPHGQRSLGGRIGVGIREGFMTGDFQIRSKSFSDSSGSTEYVL